MTTFCYLLSCAALAGVGISVASATDYGPNGYWPGDFEASFIGGMYSTDLKCKISRAVNHTEGGSGSWEIGNGYQHLELLLPAKRKAKVSFWAMSALPQTLDINVITPTESAEDDPKTTRKIIHTIKIEPSEEWTYYEREFDMVEPYPYLRASEVLLSSYNGEKQSWFIDDLAIQWEEKHDDRWTNADIVVNGDFEAGDSSWSGAVLGVSPNGGHALVAGSPKSETAATASAVQTLDASAVAGKRVRISADIAYQSFDDVEANWPAVVIGISGDGTPILATDAWPLWTPLGLAGPVGEFKNIAAEFDIPEDVESMHLRSSLSPASVPTRPL